MGDKNSKDGDASHSDEDMKAKLTELRRQYEEEKQRRADLEKKLSENEKKFTEQYQKLLDVEQGIISGEEAIRTIEREHIDSLTHHLRKEHKIRIRIEKEREDERKASDGELSHKDVEIVEKEKIIHDLEHKLDDLRGKLADKDDKMKKHEEEDINKMVGVGGLAADLDIGFEGYEDSRLVQMQDILKLVGRIGRIRLSDVSRNLDMDQRRIVEHIRLFQKKGLIKVENPKQKDPTLRATRKLIKKMSDLRIKLKKKGRDV